MKKQSYVLFATLSTEDIANLTIEIKETIVFGLIKPAPKVFTNAQLWNIQRQVKTKLQRRYN